ncbi:hypothetical protein AgCh_031238 [Apium graveolens]
MANPLYVQILKNGPFTPMERIEESTDGDMAIPAHYTPKDPSKYTEPKKEKYEGFMDKPKESITDVFERYNKLINDLHLHDKYYEAEESSDDEQEIGTPVVSSNEQKNKEPYKQVILELEEDEFYTLDELDELDQSMAYLARKFSNIRVKKRKFFKNKGQISNKDNSWKGKTQYKSCGKIKGKSWDDSDNDEDEEFGNYALIALEQGKSSSSIIKVLNLTTIDLNASQYKDTVEKMSMEMFLIHTSLVAATEELVGQYHKKNKPCANIVIGLDYDALNNNRKVEGDKGKATISEDVPAMLRKVVSPMFQSCEVKFSEQELIIKQ